MHALAQFCHRAVAVFRTSSRENEGRSCITFPCLDHQHPVVTAFIRKVRLVRRENIPVLTASD
eukprot:2778620-Pyramimonas_sp.AAC.2